jgi:tRNA(fMet)-specific endonuclease VapC
MRYLLDTNVISELMRKPRGAVAQRIAEVGEVNVCTSVIVAAELRSGARKKGSEKLTAQVEAILGALDVLPFEPPCDTAYATIRVFLERAGTPIGGNDLLIAAQAVTHQLVLVTDNESEFRRIDGIEAENWVRTGAGGST